MSSPDQNKANVKAFYDLAFNQRQPEECASSLSDSSLSAILWLFTATFFRRREHAARR